MLRLLHALPAFTSVILLLPAFKVFASSPLTQNAFNNELLFAGNQTVVTASRSKQPLVQAPAVVTVITGEQLQSYGAVTLLDALRYVPGVHVAEANAGVANVTIRGLNSQYANTLLVMIDNRPVNEQFTGGVFWQLVPILVSQIKRIEVVRGPGSVLYGANAYNGIINIITKTPQDLAKAGSNLQFRTVLGGYKSDYDELMASAADRYGNAFTLGFGYTHTGGFGAGGALGVHDNEAVPFISLDAQHKMASGMLRLQAGDLEYAGNFYEILYLIGLHTHTTYTVLRYDEPSSKNPLSLRLSYNNFKAVSQSILIEQTHSFEGEVQKQNQIAKHHTLVYGFTWNHTTFHGDDIFPGRHVQDLFGVYAQDEWQLPQNWLAYLGVRFDNATVYGSNFSPRISLLKRLGSDQVLRVAYGSSFQAPTLLETYLNTPVPLAPGLTGWGLGNAKLKTVTLNGLEIDWRKELSKGYLEVNGFYNSINNLIGLQPISFAPSPPYPPGTPTKLMYENVGGATLYGVEIESELQLTRRLRGLLNYTFLDQQTNSHSAFQGTFTPNHIFNAAVDARLGGKWDAFVGFHAVGASRLSTFGVFTNAPAYANMDLRLGYQLRGGKEPLTLALIAHNLFGNRHIEQPPPPASGLPAQVAPIGTAVYIALEGKF
ncbi:TonB-dependent receptor plug domain-containing protein [Chthonomonas calidirosea]|uniref:TonB-dependent receptor plug domain-containing protein n=1 Tax=Chthonomonas calidirosea TaxID=454171 RepID=UPI0006ECB54E|nr:TonB-dependent receptor [Chthonomonas calidirosea]CEK20113.1 outer membrane cobalamin receptor protein [Chthonomonas calidirosea]